MIDTTLDMPIVVTIFFVVYMSLVIVPHKKWDCIRLVQSCAHHRLSYLTTASYILNGLEAQCELTWFQGLCC